MKFYVIAGEASGDLHGSSLMRGLLDEDPACEIRFMGGDRMCAVGGTMFRHYRDTAVMGVSEVLAKAGKVAGAMSACKRDIIEFAPDVVVLVDYPGFNLRIARFAHRKGIKVYYYIAPKLWAHGERRISALRRYVDRLFVIFPFEVEYFESKGVKAEYYGNPLPDSMPSGTIGSGLRGKVIALLPGSRKSEISRLLPRYVELESIISKDSRFDGYRLILAGAPSMSARDYMKYLPAGSGIELVSGRTCGILAEAWAAVVANGTANLEAVLAGTPQVSCYAMNPLTFFLAKHLVKIPMVSLPNIVLGRQAICELLQDEASADNMYRELCSIMFDEGRRAAMLEDYARLKEILGGEGASRRIARAMLS